MLADKQTDKPTQHNFLLADKNVGHHEQAHRKGIATVIADLLTDIFVDWHNFCWANLPGWFVGQQMVTGNSTVLAAHNN